MTPIQELVEVLWFIFWALVGLVVATTCNMVANFANAAANSQPLDDDEEDGPTLNSVRGME